MNLKSSVAVACFLSGWAKDLSAPLPKNRGYELLSKGPAVMWAVQ
jgi:hypothetical protein